MICYTLFLFLPVWEMTGHGVWIESCMTAEGQLLIDRSSPPYTISVRKRQIYKPIRAGEGLFRTVSGKPIKVYLT